MSEDIPLKWKRERERERDGAEWAYRFRKMKIFTVHFSRHLCWFGLFC